MGNRRRSFVLHDNSSSSHARTYRRVPVLRHKPTITFRSARLCFSQSSACSSFSQQSLRFHAHRAFVRLRCLLCTMAIACTKRTCICTVCLRSEIFPRLFFFLPGQFVRHSGVGVFFSFVARLCHRLIFSLNASKDRPLYASGLCSSSNLPYLRVSILAVFVTHFR